MKFTFPLICLCFLASCSSGSKSKPAGSQDASGVDINQALDEASCPNANDFRGVGVGGSESEALVQARSNMALEYFSQSLKSNVQVSSRNVDRVASTSSLANIEQEAALINARDAKLHFSVSNNGKTGVVACMSRADAAKGFAEQLRPVADSLKFSASNVIEAKHPKLKGEAWQKTKPLWNKFIGLYSMVEGLDKQQSAVFEPVKSLYLKASDMFLDFCQTAKLYWNPEKNDVYAEIAFSKLSKNLKLEKTACKGHGISLVYKNTGHKCEYAGMFECVHKPSLLIASCYGEEYGILESENVETYQKVEAVALEKLREKIRYESFWIEWEQEIKQWRPVCE